MLDGCYSCGVSREGDVECAVEQRCPRGKVMFEWGVSTLHIWGQNVLGRGAVNAKMLKWVLPVTFEKEQR